jgi:hypothetical protein
MSISDKFPVTFTKYEETIKFSNPEEKQKLIVCIADKVASIYAAFLTKEGTEKRSKELVFNRIPTEFPSKEIVAKFHANLSDDLIKNLNGKKEKYELSTDYAPEGSLEEILKSSGIDVPKYQSGYYFPWKTVTKIIINSEESNLKIKMRFEDFSQDLSILKFL